MDIVWEHLNSGKEDTRGPNKLPLKRAVKFKISELAHLRIEYVAVKLNPNFQEPKCLNIKEYLPNVDGVVLDPIFQVCIKDQKPNRIAVRLDESYLPSTKVCISRSF